VIRYDNIFYAYSEWVEQVRLRKGGRKGERRELIQLDIHVEPHTTPNFSNILLHRNELRTFSVPALLITGGLSPTEQVCTVTNQHCVVVAVWCHYHTFVEIAGRSLPYFSYVSQCMELGAGSCSLQLSLIGSNAHCCMATSVSQFCTSACFLWWVLSIHFCSRYSFHAVSNSERRP